MLLLVAIALTLILGIPLVIAYTAWLNGAFRRCPVCRKIGSWRYDSLAPAAVQHDEDGGIVQSRQRRVCRKCRRPVLDTWSDFGGRSFEKAED